MGRGASQSAPDVAVVVKSDDVVVVETEGSGRIESPRRDYPHPCVEMTAGMARYMLAILDLTEGDRPPSQSRLSRQLQVSAPTTSEAIGRLRKLDLVEPDSLALTGAGMSAALVLSSRRGAARKLVREVLGIDEADVELEAERIAFSASPLLGRSLVAWRVRNLHG